MDSFKAFIKDVPQRFKERKAYVDYWLIIPYVILSIIGIIMVYSASSDFYILNGTSAISFLYKQILWVIVGFLVCFLVFMVNEKDYRNSSFIKWSVAAAFVITGWLILFGKTTNGASGWLYLGPITIQPAEYIKILVVLYLADSLTKHYDDFNGDFEENKDPIWLMLALIFFNLLERDMGGSAINGAIVVVLFLASGRNFRKSVSYLVGGLAAFEIALNLFASRVNVHTSNYMLQRIVGFARPFEMSKGAGNQLVNSYYAIGNGGIFGVGLGNSIQKKGYLPEANTDFIMSVISEELGLILTVAIITLLFVIITRAIVIGIKAPSMYESLVCYGLATYLTIQTFFNVGGVTGLIPITGVTFPFISYGGSSTMVTSIAMGILLNMSFLQKRNELELKGEA